MSNKNKHGSGVDPKVSAEERVAADDTEQIGDTLCECAPDCEGGELPRSGGMTEPSDRSVSAERSDAERPQAECESVAASQGDGDLSEVAERDDDSMRECGVFFDESGNDSEEKLSGIAGGDPSEDRAVCANASGGTRVAAVKKRHRKRRKLVILAASVALIAAILSVLFFACNAKEGVETRQPKDSVSICLEPPTDGSTPDDHTALDNLGYIIGRLMERDMYHTDSSSVVTANAFGVEVRQDVTGGKDYKDGIMIATTFSSSDSSFAPAPVALQKFFGKDKAVIRNSVSSDPETWAGKDTEWSDGEPSEVVEKSSYTDRYGLWATEFSDYVFTEETVLSATVTPPYDGNYIMELALDPATSTYYYAKQMVTMGGLSSAPTFSYVNVTISFTADWTITEMRVSEKYTSSKGPLNASTQGETVIKYSYDEASVDVSAYETYFSGYADAAPSISESVKTASDYLAEGFGGVLVSDRTAFDITATIAGRTIAGRALLCMDGGSPTSVRLEFGQLSVFADLNGGNVYISVGDAVGYFALADIQSLFGGSSDIHGELGGSSDIHGEPIGGATLVETDGGAIVTMTLPVAGGLPVEFTFSDESGNIEWTEISLSLDAFGTDISLSVTPGSADAEFGETDTLGAVYLTPAFSSVAEMIESGMRLDLGYEGDGFTLRGNVTIDITAGAFSGEAVLEISGKTPVTATFAYSDGELYLAAGGIKVRADAGEWADALLGLLSSDTSGALPDIGETAGALIDLGFGGLIDDFTLTQSGLAIVINGDALLGALFPDAGLTAGQITAAYDFATAAFDVTFGGATLCVSPALDTPVIPDGEEYVSLPPQLLTGFADAAKSLAGADVMEISASGQVTLGGVTTEIEINGAFTTGDVKELVLNLTVSDRTINVFCSGGSVTIVVGTAGFTVGETDIAEISDALKNVLGDGDILAELDIATLLADLRLVTAEANGIGIAADLSSLLSDSGADVTLSYLDGGISACGSIKLAGIALENADVRFTAGSEVTRPDFTDVTFCSGVAEFVLEAYMRLSGSEYITIGMSYYDGNVAVDMGGEVRLIRAESGIDIELSADVILTSGGTPYYLRAQVTGGTVYVYFSLVGFEESAYFPDSVSDSAAPLKAKFALSSLADATRDVMPVIASLVGVESGRGGFEFVADLIAGVHDSINTDVTRIKSVKEWVEFVKGILGGSFGEGGSGSSTSADGLTLDCESRTLVITGEGMEITLTAGEKFGVRAPAGAESYTDYSSVADLADVLMRSVTTPSDDGTAVINDYYYLSGSASGSLGSFELASIGLAASVYVRDDFSVEVNLRVSVNFFVGVFNGDTVTDITIKDDAVYMRRVQTSEGEYIESQLDEPIVIYRAMSVDEFIGSMLDQVGFIFNFSDGIKDKMTGGSGGGVKDIGSVLVSFGHSVSADGSQTWTIGLDLSSLTDGVLSDATVVLGAGAGGMLEYVDVTASLSILTMSASLGYVNPAESMESGHAHDVTQDVSATVGEATGELPASGYIEGYAATVTYVADGSVIGSQNFIYDGSGRLLTELALPDLSALSGGGYTYSWNVPSSVSGDFTLEAVRTPNVYSVRLVSEYELPDMEYAVYDGAYVYELSYTYGEKTELPCGASVGDKMLLRFEDESGRPYMSVSGITRDVTLTAVWADNGCIVTYTVLGEPYTKQVYAAGDALVLPEITVSGYEFVRWDTDITTVTDDMTVNAVLSVTVSLTSEFAAGGMTQSGDEYSRELTLTGMTADDFALSESATSDGRHHFGWWRKGAAGWQRVRNIGGMDGEKVYAAWISDLSVTITEAKKSTGLWTINGVWSCGFDGNISAEIAKSAAVTTSASAYLKLSKDGVNDFDTLNSGKAVSADGGAFGKSDMTSFNALFGKVKYGGAKVTVTYSCGDLSLTLESTAWRAV